MLLFKLGNIPGYRKRGSELVCIESSKIRTPTSVSEVVVFLAVIAQLSSTYSLSTLLQFGEMGTFGSPVTIS